MALLAAGSACTNGNDSTDLQGPSKTVLDLVDVKTNPTNYEWFDFRPNVKKLILSGAAETEHVAILWYTVVDGSVGLHYHSKTESVYVIDGTQTDAKGVYPTGTVYFNPPGSGHQISDSSGFFVLAYASPPDFANTASIGEYSPLRIDTTDPELMTKYPFEEKAAGLRAFEAPLDSAGGMSGQFIEIAASDVEHTFTGNYLLVLGGRCAIDGATLEPQRLVVAKTIEPQPFSLAAAAQSSCLAMGVSFRGRIRGGVAAPWRRAPGAGQPAKAENARVRARARLASLVHHTRACRTASSESWTASSPASRSRMRFCVPAYCSGSNPSS